MPPPIDPFAQAEKEAIAWLGRLRARGGDREQAAFEAWYVADPLNADAYDRVLKSWDTLAVAASTPAGRTRRPFFGGSSSTRWGRYALATAAAAALVGIIGVGGRPFGMGQDSLIPAAYASVVGQIRTITLPDGSHVTLDTNTAMQAAFTKEERRLRLVHGRARFKVAADPRPFIVEAGRRSITAAGTTFDVDLVGGRLAVVLFDGSVEIRGPAGSADPARQLAHGQTLSFAPDASAGRLGAVQAVDSRWTSGMLSFEDASLADVVERANLYARVKIVLADDAVRRLRFTGTFKPTEPEPFARMLAAMFTLTLTHDAAGNVVLRQRAGARSF